MLGMYSGRGTRTTSSSFGAPVARITPRPPTRRARWVAERTGAAPAALSAFAGRGAATLETTAEAAHCAAIVDLRPRPTTEDAVRCERGVRRGRLHAHVGASYVGGEPLAAIGPHGPHRLEIRLIRWMGSHVTIVRFWGNDQFTNGKHEITSRVNSIQTRQLPSETKSRRSTHRSPEARPHD